MPYNCLQSITISKNDIRTFYELDFSFNKLTQIPKHFHEMFFMSFYDLSYNNINTVSKTDFDILPHVMYLNLSDNNLRSLPQDTLNDLFLLNELNLSHNFISDLPENIFDKNIFLQKLDFDSTNSLKVLRLESNDIVEFRLDNTKPFRFENIENHFCSSPPKLNGTSLANIQNNLLCDYAENCPVSCHCYIDDIENILWVLIDCTNSKLTHFPNITSYGLSVAIHLNLSHNQISSLPSKSDPIWTKITILDLSHNRIDTLKNMTLRPILTTLYLTYNSLSEFDHHIASLSQVTHLKLANNPWKCNCEMSKLLYKSEIVYYMFSKGICLKFVSDDDIDADKVYDAFVSYSNEDENWIRDFLVPGLETGNPTYNLCLHNRDWLAGEFITDQIVKSVKSSRRTIIVLTDNFLNSPWSRLEFDVAYQQGLKDQVRRLLIVIPNEVPDLSQIDPNFKTFITLTTYIQANKPHFWSKLRASMPRTKPKSKSSTTRRSVYLNSDVSHEENIEMNTKYTPGALRLIHSEFGRRHKIASD
uniref:TIR domain-containing protein n=1 Tax=Strigamia maritima TaxID=126957 RepID=T1J8N8_STRMM